MWACETNANLRHFDDNLSIFGAFLEDFSKVRKSADEHLRRERLRTFDVFPGFPQRCS